MSTKTRKIAVTVFSFILLLGVITNIKTTAYTTMITFTGKTILIDVSKGLTPTDFTNLNGNLTNSLNTVNFESTNLEATINADALIISKPTAYYNTLEKTYILDFISSGNKSLLIGGDADFGGYNNTYINDLLGFLGSKIRLDSSQIIDPDYNDGMDYRVAAVDYGIDPIGVNVSNGCVAGIIMHGTAAILGYENSNVVDLRTNPIEGVEILLSFSENSTALNTDGSDSEYDLYSKVPPEETGNYPAVVCETLLINGKKGFIILAGESIHSDYKNMYDQYTETGTYNGGIHYGQMFVNNLLNYFLDTSNYIIEINEFSKINILSLVTIVPIIVGIAVFSKKKKK